MKAEDKRRDEQFNVIHPHPHAKSSYYCKWHGEVNFGNKAEVRFWQRSPFAFVRALKPAGQPATVAGQLEGDREHEWMVLLHTDIYLRLTLYI